MSSMGISGGAQSTVIRDAVVEDVSAIVRLNEETRIGGYSTAGFLLLPLSTEQVITEIISGDISYVVCETDQEVVAFAKHSNRELDEWLDIGWPDAPVDITQGIHVEKLCVAEGHRGIGIGRSIYAFLRERLPNRPLYSFIVVSPVVNIASLRFHRTLGFRPLAHVPYTLPDGSWALDLLHVLDA